MRGGRFKWEGEGRRRFVGFWAAGRPSSLCRIKRHTSKQLGRPVPPNDNSADKSVGVEVDTSLVAREINCVSNDGSDRSL